MYSREMGVRWIEKSVTVANAVAVGILFCGSLRIEGAEAQRIPDRLLVKAKHGISERTVHARLAAHGASQQSMVKPIGVRLVHVPSARLDAVLNGLKHDPRIEFAEPDYLLTPALTPGDTYYSYEWHLPKIQA